MKSSPCSTLAILHTVLVEATAELDEVRQQASDDPHTWRRLLLLEPKVRAKAIPRREISSAANVPTVMRMNEDDVIAPELHSPAAPLPVGSPVQVPRKVWKPKTKRARDMLRLIEALPEPWTTTRVARAYELTEQTARYWLNLFSARLGWECVPGAGGGYRRKA